MQRAGQFHNGIGIFFNIVIEDFFDLGSKVPERLGKALRRAKAI
jgi:hypothetical protein